MEGLIKHEQLPATSDPPTVTNTAPSAVVEVPPPYASAVPSQQVIEIRDTYDEAPPGVIAKAIISIVGSIIVFFMSYLTVFCAIPSVIFAALALSPTGDPNQRRTYANTALGLFVAGLVTMVICIVVVVVILFASVSYTADGYY